MKPSNMKTPLLTSLPLTGLVVCSLGLLIGGLGLSACTPTVKVDTREPITINLNVNIKHEILIKVDKELDDVLSEDSGLF